MSNKKVEYGGRRLWIGSSVGDTGSDGRHGGVSGQVQDTHG